MILGHSIVFEDFWIYLLLKEIYLLLFMPPRQMVGGNEVTPYWTAFDAG
jgi:hypothetical protein